MIKFTVKLVFVDADENLYTKGKAQMTFEVEADDAQTAHALGQRLQRQFAADHLIVAIGE